MYLHCNYIVFTCFTHLHCIYIDKYIVFTLYLHCIYIVFAYAFYQCYEPIYFGCIMISTRTLETIMVWATCIYLELLYRNSLWRSDHFCVDSRSLYILGLNLIVCSGGENTIFDTVISFLMRHQFQSFQVIPKCEFFDQRCSCFKAL